VFADLGLPNAEELGTKVRLAASLNAILAARKLTQAKPARLLGVNQPKVRGPRQGRAFYSIPRRTLFHSSPGSL
jgi:predicted XRE-type DNA-binding protein